jgi:preprotein translocase subunit SecE
MSMNRQMRRQQAQLKPGRAGGGSRPPKGPSLSGGGGGGVARPRGGGIFRTQWIRDIISELRKVQWPTKEEAWNLTWVVVLVSVAVGIVLGGLDSAFGWFMQHVVLHQ